jgi:beta-lactamase regulating signal transducer with metallopeptidase domain
MKPRRGDLRRSWTGLARIEWGIAPMLWWFAETTLVAAALAAVAALAPRLRPLGPATRHALWLVVLIKLMTPPLLSWPWPVFTRPPPARGPSAPAVMIPGVDPDGEGMEPVAVATPRTAIGDGDGDGDSDGDGDGDGNRDRVGAGPPDRPRWLRPDTPTLGRWAFVAWLAVASALAAVQVLRVVRFHRWLRRAVPAPAWLVEEADRVGQRLGVGVPEALAVTGLAVPMLWCLGRPRLLLPARLIGTIDVARWRGVLAHELAHLRRGDHWVRRLAIVAGWVWWWSPLYWIARRKIDAEAELACDAWVVWALPDDRIVYAETLLDICTSLSTAMTPLRKPVPALGVTGSGRLFERRLTMILRDHVPCRLSVPGLFGAGLLVLLALPSWTTAEPPDDRDRPVVATDDGSLVAPPTRVGGGEAALVDVDDDDDDDPDKPESAKKAPRAKAASKAARAKAANKAPRAKVVKLQETEKDTTAPSAGKDKGKIRIEIDLSDIEKSFGPDSDFAKNLERLGPEIEEAMKKKFGPGSEFEAKMKQLGERMEKQFGPGSKFETEMKELGERMEKKFGPGSKFETEMKELGERIEKQYGPGSEFEAKLKEKTRKAPDSAPKPAPRPGRSSREERIRNLESQIDKLMRELKRLKAEDSERDDEPRAGADGLQ